MNVVLCPVNPFTRLRISPLDFSLFKDLLTHEQLKKIRQATTRATQYVSQREATLRPQAPQAPQQQGDTAIDQIGRGLAAAMARSERASERRATTQALVTAAVPPVVQTPTRPAQVTTPQSAASTLFQRRDIRMGMAALGLAVVLFTAYKLCIHIESESLARAIAEFKPQCYGRGVPRKQRFCDALPANKRREASSQGGLAAVLAIVIGVYLIGKLDNLFKPDEAQQGPR